MTAMPRARPESGFGAYQEFCDAHPESWRTRTNCRCPDCVRVGDECRRFVLGGADSPDRSRVRRISPGDPSAGMPPRRVDYRWWGGDYRVIPPSPRCPFLGVSESLAHPVAMEREGMALPLAGCSDRDYARPERGRKWPWKPCLRPGPLIGRWFAPIMEPPLCLDSLIGRWFSLAMGGKGTRCDTDMQVLGLDSGDKREPGRLGAELLERRRDVAAKI